MARIRTLVVDDSLTVRRLVCAALAADPEIEVVGEATDGAAGIEMCERLRPDVVTLDMAMPVLTGVDATLHIMEHCPTRILIVSSSTNRADLFGTYEALAAGAVDVLEKPTGREPDGVWEAELCRAVRVVSKVPVITRMRSLRPTTAASTSSASTSSSQSLPRATPPTRVLGIGASTGGPGAIVQILRTLPAPSPVPVLVVLHLSRGFEGALASWLDEQSDHRVVVATDGMPLAAGPIVLAPPDRHLVLQQGRLRLTDTPERHSCRPSIDVLYDSLAVEIGAGAVACVLTGMGKDGASGLLAIRRAGGLTYAQDEETCVVYGMPREAAEIGAAVHVLPLAEIGQALARAARPPRARQEWP